MHAMVSSTQTQTFQGGEGFSREARPFFFLFNKIFQGSCFFSIFHWTQDECVCVCVYVGQVWKSFSLSLEEWIPMETCINFSVEPSHLRIVSIWGSGNRNLT